MKIKVTEYIAQFMAEHGVTDVFTVTGGGAMHLNDAFGHSKKLKCTYNHNEQGSAIAAESYARLTGKIALCCVTSGPGGTNAITGVMGGWLDSIPMFIVSGQVKRETTVWSCPDIKLRALGDQEFHITDAVSCMTKYCEMITEPNDIAYHLEKAWYLANNGRKGPVWLDIPLDVQGAPVETEELKHFCARCEGLENPGYETKCVISGRGKDDGKKFEIIDADETAVRILDKIASAKAPLIFAGEGVRLAGAADDLLKLVRKLKVPVAAAWNSGDLVAYDDPCYAGSPSREGTRGSSFIVQNCDLLLVLGSRMGIRTITYNKHDFGKNAYKIMVDIDQNELDKPTFLPDMKIKGDVKAVVDAMLNADYRPAACHETWRRWCRSEVERYPAVVTEYHNADCVKGGKNTGLINPYVFIDKLSNRLKSDDVITLGNGSACVMTFTALKIKQGQRMYTNNGCAAMGYGMPAALGAAVARRRETGKNPRVICIDGDGSVMMNIQELQTIAHNRLNVKLFVLDNNGYNSIRQTQTNLFNGKLVGVDPGSGVSFPDFEKLADAFGLKYYHIDSEATADMIIDNALAAEGPVLIRAQVDPAQNFVPKLSSRVLPDGRIVSPSMDDMFPFLSREEYADNKYKG